MDKYEFLFQLLTQMTYKIRTKCIDNVDNVYDVDEMMYEYKRDETTRDFLIDDVPKFIITLLLLCSLVSRSNFNK